MSAGANKLNHAMKTLRERFDLSETGWHDQVRADFETRQIEPTELQVAATMRAMVRLDEVLRKMRRDCGDPDRDY